MAFTPSNIQFRPTPPTGSNSKTDYDAVVIGAGMAGLYMLHSLREMGLTARVYETGSGVGGTWFWNRYPGARCDSESFYYCYTFDEELEQEWNYSARYPGQSEILSYLEHVADRYDLRRDIVFNTKVQGAHYDEAENVWRLTTDTGEAVTATYLISAVGCLSAANVPDIPGLSKFKGEWYHTGNWPKEPVDFTGKRVAVVGTGSSGIQSIPILAEQSGHLTVFQRTAQFSIPARNRPLEPEEVRRVKENYLAVHRRARYTNVGFDSQLRDVSALEVSPEEAARQFQAEWDEGGFKMIFAGYKDIITDIDANTLAADFIRSKIREVVKDPETAEKLIPRGYPFGTKRPVIDTNYFETYNRDNVDLVDIKASPIQEITETGIRTADSDYELDVIIFATGFDANTGSLNKIDIRGRSGAKLSELWADGPRAYLGLSSHGFPNMFMITGPGSPAVFSNMPMSIEQHVEWIQNALWYMREHGYDYLEAETEAETRWVEHVAGIAENTLFPLADSWYMGSNIPGKPRMLIPFASGVGEYRELCVDIAAKGYPGFIKGEMNESHVNGSTGKETSAPALV